MKMNKFNIENVMLDYNIHQFEEIHEIAKETIKENETLKNTIDIQKIKIDMLEKEKQQFISFLKVKIKEYKKTEKYLYEEENTKLVEKARVMGIIGAYQEVLDFVNKE